MQLSPRVNQTDPRPADEEAIELLRSECPHMAEEVCPNYHLVTLSLMFFQTHLCCSTRQLRDLQVNFARVSAFLAAPCPTCWWNFRKNFCDMTCSPDQASFVKADNIVTGPGFDDYEGQEVEMVESVTYFAHTEFIEGMYDSCKDVNNPALGPVMSFFCGEWGAENCDAYKMCNFQGSVSNGYAPFTIHYDYSNESMTEDGEHVYHNPPAVPCHEAAPHQDQGCDCQQCSTACGDTPPLTFPETEGWFSWEKNSNLIHFLFAINPDFTLQGHDGLAVIMAGIFVVGSLIFLGFASNLFRWIGKKQNEVTVSFFTWWGAFAARHPLPVIFLSIAIVASLCSGLHKLEVTTDPIELWASPDSRCRVEKDFFDSQFRPFYRTALVIARAHHSPEHGMDFISSGGTKFSPMFNKVFLKALLKLQKDIEAIEVDYLEGEQTRTLSLTDVCFKPLSRAPGDVWGDDTVNEHCSINNIWAYWQDKESNLDLVVNKTDMDITYLDHFTSCTNNPSQTQQSDKDMFGLGCLSKWGGPVQPWYTLGGFIPGDFQGILLDISANQSLEYHGRTDWGIKKIWTVSQALLSWFMMT